MFENNWIAEQLVHSRQRNLQEKANQARQVQHAQQANKVQRHRRLIEKLQS